MKKLVAVPLVLLVPLLGLAMVLNLAGCSEKTEDTPEPPVKSPLVGTEGWSSFGSTELDLKTYTWFDDQFDNYDPDEDTRDTWIRVKDRTGDGPWSEVRAHYSFNCYKGTYVEEDAYMMGGAGQPPQELVRVTPGNVIPQSSVPMIAQSVCQR